jgi:2-oxoglutarate dehydrogenase E1 component
VPSDWSEFAGANRGYILDLYERYRADPESVDAITRALFERLGPPAWPQAAESRRPEAGPQAGLAEGEAATALARAAALIASVRSEGHRFAHLDPLAGAAPAAAALTPAAFGLSEAALSQLAARSLAEAGVAVPADCATGLDVYRHVFARYVGGPLAFEFAHVADAQQRAWLAETVEGRDGPLALAPTADDRRALLASLTRVEGLERYLHTNFPGVKRFSIEGVDSLVPLLDTLVRAAVDDGARRVVVGMAHRGRLNVLAHVMGKPYGNILAEFADHDVDRARSLAAQGFSGDVKYHVGWRRTVDGPDGSPVELWLCNNPSHLEFVDPVALGVARSAQDDRTRAGEPGRDARRACAFIVHGDAAFPGEGVVAETLNLSHLAAYDVGGSVHVIANNQIGFTTDSTDARSTRYASDLAKAFDIPIVHVNADAPEACVAAARLAWAFRQRFGRSILIDLVGYRRWGHNESDEPSFTQPEMYARVRTHPTVRALYAEALARDGVVAADDAEAMAKAVADALAAARRTATPASVATPVPTSASAAEQAPAPVTLERLARIGRELLARPEGLAPNARVERTLRRREGALERDRGVDWGYAETLAFATLLEDGVPIRLVGQDTQRGTFAQRHLVLHDERDGRRYTPMHHLTRARASFAVHNSPLSETAALGFEYGYSVGAPDALVLWEAQYGDFANVAQVIVDQFIAAGRAKWGEASALVLLLPHGYEGQGPEHSSARLERYLQLAAENNLTIAYPTTAAQIFHLLRRQARALGAQARPLVVMSPKSLLRHPLAASDAGELVGGSFAPVLDDPEAAARAERVERAVLVSGKVAVEYLTARARIAGDDAAALIRLEQLYPFPEAELAAALARYPRVREAVWLQEEPRNMGAWTFVAPRLGALLPSGVALTYVGPPAHAAPATGFAALHAAEMERIVREALGAPVAAGSA